MGLNTKGLAMGHSIVEDLRVSFINNVKNHDYILGNLCSLSQCTTVLGQQARGLAKYYDGTPSMTVPIVDGFGNAIYVEVRPKSMVNDMVTHYPFSGTILLTLVQIKQEKSRCCRQTTQ
jgi:hypothetical protein